MISCMVANVSVVVRCTAARWETLWVLWARCTARLPWVRCILCIAAWRTGAFPRPEMHESLSRDPTKVGLSLQAIVGAGASTECCMWRERAVWAWRAPEACAPFVYASDISLLLLIAETVDP